MKFKLLSDCFMYLIYSLAAEHYNVENLKVLNKIYWTLNFIKDTAENETIKIGTLRTNSQGRHMKMFEVSRTTAHRTDSWIALEHSSLLQLQNTRVRFLLLLGYFTIPFHLLKLQNEYTIIIQSGKKMHGCTNKIVMLWIKSGKFMNLKNLTCVHQTGLYVVKKV